jgi:hypothetical protein
MPAEAKEIFEAASRSVRELLNENGLGLYIPAYQRPYGWDKDNVEKLIDDTLHGFSRLRESDDSFTFLGTIITIHDTNYSTVHPIVKDEVPSKVLIVIDGQQRLCSLALLAVCLHNQIRIRHSKVFTPLNRELSVAEEWLNGQSLNFLKTLASCIFEQQAYGDSPIYPRIIRAFDDQWSKKSSLAKYDSPIAHLISEYSKIAEAEKPRDFRPNPRQDIGDGEAELVRRYREIRGFLNILAAAKDSESIEGMPELSEIADNKKFQRSLFSHDFPVEVVQELKGAPSPEFSELIRLLMLAAYVLHRVAMTVVKGKNEDYAFTIYESLNTTGEPLTAFETFKPRVVSSEGIGEYESSLPRGHIDGIGDYLSQFKAGTQLQIATRDLLVSFALAETGYKLPKRLADQRTYLKDEYDRYAENPTERVNFLKHLHETSDFVQHVWEPGKSGTPNFHRLPVDATTDSMKLCIAFLRKLNHSVVVAPIVRFYSEALHADPGRQQQSIQDLEDAIRAMTAFSVFWRASRRTTANIDREYRYIMSGVSSRNFPPLARKAQRGKEFTLEPSIDVTSLKQELSARLHESGGISSRETWVSQASYLPIYEISGVLTRFLLLAAYHDTVEDEEKPGLIIPGKEQVNPCFTFEGWRNESHLSVEHIAPREAGGNWSAWLYSDRETVHRIGNLVLAPLPANSSFGNRPWQEKRVLYSALGAKSKENARDILAKSSSQGIGFGESTEKLIDMSTYTPHLAALGEKIDEWDQDFLQERSERLLHLVWSRLYPWISDDDSETA